MTYTLFHSDCLSRFQPSGSSVQFDIDFAVEDMERLLLLLMILGGMLLAREENY
jgi:hypothetical protein